MLSLLGAGLAYLVATVLVVGRLFHPQGPSRPVVALIASVAIFAHGIVLKQQIVTPTGQDFSIPNVLSLAGWFIGFGYTAMLLRLKVIVLAPVIYGLSLLSLILQVVIPSDYILQLSDNPWMLGHISLSLIAFATLMIASLYAIQLWMIRQKLKNKSGILSPSLPPLLTVEKQLYTLLTVGTLLLGLTLGTGLVFIEDMFTGGNGHKFLLTLFSLGIYSRLLWLHQNQGVTIKSAVAHTLIASFLLFLAYFGARFVKEFILV
ncbi:inner membrane protein YpjD [Paraferrimonas sp. SM1919]|uniref:cytochrome C assembly family protein n=1 Tax=Paraferrimonas sp. SM1919 TaxID=2662263 RepID=UPI0013D2CB01|nr:cytochrome c biogenesis protein CcsA [Paraferrimonas sp. SM1919]